MKINYFSKLFQFLFELFNKKSIKTNNSLLKEALYGKVKSIKIMQYNISEKFGKINKDTINLSTISVGDNSGHVNLKIFFDKAGESKEYNWYDSNDELDKKSLYKNKNQLYSEWATYDSNGDISTLNITEFDNNGTKTQSKHYNSKGNLDYIFKYNKKGHFIELTYYNSEGRIRDTKTYKYNENGKKTEEKHFEPNEKGTLQLKLTFELTYDKKRNLIREFRYYPNGFIFYEQNYKYDTNNNLIEHIDHFKDKYFFKYDLNGKEIEKIWYRHMLDDKLLKTFTTKYNEIGKQIENATHNSEGILILKETYKYDENGNKTCYLKFEPDRGVDFKILYKYDNNGYVIESKQINSEGESNYENTFKFKFDKKNNWTERIKFEYGHPKYMIERIIEYY